MALLNLPGVCGALIQTQRQNLFPFPAQEADVIECVDDLGGRGKEMLPRKQSDKRKGSPRGLSGHRKRTSVGLSIIDQIVKSGSGKFVPSDFQDSVNVALQYSRIGSSTCVFYLVYLKRLAGSMAQYPLHCTTARETER